MMEKEAKQKDKCEKNVIKALSSSQRVQILLKALSESQCSLKSSDICCEQCEQSSLLGGYEQSTKQIVICSNNCQSAKKVEEILAHELIHTYDDCTVQKMDFTDEQQLACSEIRAANLISCPKSYFNFSYKSHESCVKIKASQSVALIKEVSLAKACDIVNSVFNQCIQDQLPFESNQGVPLYFNRIKS